MAQYEHNTIVHQFYVKVPPVRGFIDLLGTSRQDGAVPIIAVRPPQDTTTVQSHILDYRKCQTAVLCRAYCARLPLAMTTPRRMVLREPEGNTESSSGRSHLRASKPLRWSAGWMLSFRAQSRAGVCYSSYRGSEVPEVNALSGGPPRWICREQQESSTSALRGNTVGSNCIGTNAGNPAISGAFDGHFPLSRHKPYRNR